MKKYFLIGFIFISFVSCAQVKYYTLNRKYIPSTGGVSFLKNVRITPFSAASDSNYNAFHTCFKSGPDQMTLIYRMGKSEIVDGTLSYAHLYRGRTYEVNYHPNTDTWDTPIGIDSEANRDLSDVHCGGRMDNGQYVYFSSISPVAIAYLVEFPTGPWPSGHFVPFFRKAADSTLNWGARVELTGYDTSLRSGTPFGQLMAGSRPGEYYIGFCQFGYGSSETGKEIYVVKTTDYWNTWTYHLVYSCANCNFTETACNFLGNDKLWIFTRIEQGGYLTMWKSADSAHTWTAVTQDVRNNTGWNYLNVKIPSGSFMYNNQLYLMEHDRDSKFTSISKANDTSFFSSAVPVFNPMELYWHTDHGSGGNPSLGYPTCTYFDNGKFISIIAQENNHYDADLFYTMDDLTTDASLPVAPPTVAASFITSTTFRLDISGYTDAQLQNIRYFSIDVSTSPSFASFITANYNGNSSTVDHVGATMQNARMTALYISLNALTTATTYYIRIKAVNNNGSSSYTTINVTTS